MFKEQSYQAIINIIFSNILTIKQLNSKFFKELSRLITNDHDMELSFSKVKNQMEKIAMLFQQYTPFFKLYGDYAKNCESSLDFIAKHQAINLQFQRFLVTSQSNPRTTPATTLSSLLITPIQRIPRYKLLLNELLSISPDIVCLQLAYEQIQQVALNINESVRQAEQAIILQQLSAQFINNEVNFLQPGRKLLKSGPLLKRSIQNINNENVYMFFLCTDCLLYAKVIKSFANDKKIRYKLHQKIPINQQFLIYSLGLLHSSYDNQLRYYLLIKSSIKTFHIAAANEYMAMEWFEALTDVADDYKLRQYNRIKHLSYHFHGDTTSSNLASIPKDITMSSSSVDHDHHTLAGHLHILIIQAKNIINKHYQQIKPYCQLVINGNKDTKQKTEIITHTTSSNKAIQWLSNEFIFHCQAPPMLTIKIKDDIMLNTNTTLGILTIDIQNDQYVANQSITQWYNLTAKSNQVAGQIQLKITWFNNE